MYAGGFLSTSCLIGGSYNWRRLENNYPTKWEMPTCLIQPCVCGGRGGRFEFPWNKAQRRNFILKILLVWQDGFIPTQNLGSFAVIPFLSNTPVQFSLRERAWLHGFMLYFLYSVTENLIISLSLSFDWIVVLFILIYPEVKLKTPKCCFQADPWELHAGFARNTAEVRMKERHSERNLTQIHSVLFHGVSLRFVFWI